MTSGISGVTGVSGLAAVQNPELTPEKQQGGTADPRHAHVGRLDNQPYPWEAFPGETHGPYGTDSDLLGMEVTAFEYPAGYLGQDPTADLQPYTRAAPWPKGVPQGVDPDSVVRFQEQTAAIHAQNFGASRNMQQQPTLNPVQDAWVGYDGNTPGESIQEDVPGQIKTGGAGGWGSTDRTQSYARQNSYDFDAAHVHRRVATGSIPGNYLWMNGASRPQIVVSASPNTAQIPNGPDSQFTGQDPRRNFDTHGAVLTDLPVAYSPPPDPAQASSYTGLGTSYDTGVDLW